MIKAWIIGDEAVIAWLGQKEPKITDGVRKTTKSLTLMLLRKVKEEKLSGQVLKNITGKLRRSVHDRYVESPTSSSGEVVTNTEYAGINEYGGQTKPHIILPKNKGALAFNIYGNWTTLGTTTVVKSVHHPGSKFPERSFMRSALAEMKPTIQSSYEQTVRESLK
jgi:phage gpG-like protein